MMNEIWKGVSVVPSSTGTAVKLNYPNVTRNCSGLKILYH